MRVRIAQEFFVPNLRAQRLSASQQSSRGNGKRRECRNRECSTPFGITAVVTNVMIHTINLQSVLNAFRHHSSRHSPIVWLTYRLTISCSTPFGITAVVTLSVRSNRSPRTMCSTPFGITAVVTDVSRMASASNSSAQRLSASQQSSLEQTPEGYQRIVVLNAFRHHSSRH